MFYDSYEQVVARDRPAFWWRISRTGTYPNLGLGGYGATMATIGTGGDVPLGRGIRLPGAATGGAGSFRGTINTVGQGFATPAHTLPTNQYTYELWAWASSITNAESNLFGRYNQTASAAGRRWQGVSVTSSRELRYTLSGLNQSGFSQILSSTNVFLLNRWNHIVATILDTGGGNVGGILYVNNRRVGAGLAGAYDASGSIVTAVSPSGVDGGTATNNFSFQGFIAEPAIYPYVLTPAQIDTHYRAGLGMLQRSLPFYPFTAPDEPPPPPGGLTAITEGLPNRRVLLVSDRPR